MPDISEHQDPHPHEPAVAPHSPGGPRFSVTLPGIDQAPALTLRAAPHPRPDFKREDRNRRLVCCCAVLVTLLMSGLGGIAAYYLFFKLPEPF